MAYEKFTRKQLLHKIADLEKALFETELRAKRGDSEKGRIIRHIADYAKTPLKYRTPYNCGRTF